MSSIPVPFTLRASMISYAEDPDSYWDEPGDTYDGKAYRWQITVQIQPQSIGTQAPYYGSYTEVDIQVGERIGDWITLSCISPSTTLQIIDFVFPPDGSNIVQLLVEDVDRYNQYLRGEDGGINPNSDPGKFDALIYRLGEDGLPIFVDLKPEDVGQDVLEEINSRFKYRNYLQNNYRVYQENNTFAVGDQITLNANNTYTLASSVGTSAYRVIGRIKDINIPRSGWFTYEPKGKLVRNLSPNLPGSAGGIVYLDPNNPGKLTASKPNSGIAIPLFVKIDNTTGVKLDEVLQGGLDNYIATRAPAVSDDSSLGYNYGSIWVDITNKKSYINVDPAIGQSIWQLIGSATSTLASKTVVGSVQIGDNIEVTAQGLISVPKGAGINKVVDILDVDSSGLANGALLTYDNTRSKWVATDTIDLNIDGGEY
jgi:hypothetical protein